LDKEERDIIHTESRQPAAAAAAAANFPAGFKPKIKIKIILACAKEFLMRVVLFFPFKPDLIFVQEIRKKIFFYSSQSSPTGAGPTRCAPYNHIYPPPHPPPPKSERTRTRRRTSSSSICCWPGVWPHVTTHVAPHLIDTMIMEGRRRRRSQKEEGDDDNNAGPGWLAGWPQQS
jgi:hypothetical protein